MRSVFIHYLRVALVLILFILTLISISKIPLYAQTFTLPQSEAITSKQGLPQAFVPAIVQDRQGFIWMATRDGLCRYDGKHFKVFQPTTDGKPGISSSGLSGLGLDRLGRIWIFGDQNAIDIMDPVRETFVNFSREPFFKRLLGLDFIRTHYFDQKGQLWLSFRSNKIACIDPITHRFRLYKLPPFYSDDCTFIQDKQRTVWVSTDKGLYRLDPLTNQFIQYFLPDNAVRGICLLPNGHLFIQTNHSILILDTRSSRIRSFALPHSTTSAISLQNKSIVTDSEGNTYFSNQYNDLLRFSETEGVNVLVELKEGVALRSLLIDRSDVLWVGTDKAGILKYNLKASQFKAVPYQHNFYTDLFIRELGVSPAQMPFEIEKDIPYYFRYTVDKAGKLWFNTGYRRFYKLDLQTKQITSISVPPTVGLRHYWDKPIAPMATDPAGHVWVVTDSLAMWYEAGQWRLFQHPIRGNDRANGLRPRANSSNVIEGEILQVVVDKQALWIATATQGLYRVDRTNGQIRAYKHQSKNLNSLSSNQLFCLYDDPFDQNSLWVGTFGSGLCRFDKRTGTCRRFSTQTGLPNNVIYSAIPDQQGFLWICTNQGLCRMDRRTFQTSIYTEEDGLLENEFNRFHFLHLPNDRILMGGLEGITSFFPRQLHDDTYQPSIQITNIQLNNQPIISGPLTNFLPIQAVSRLELPYNQNFIAVHFAALQYNRHNKIRYRYQLIGLNQQWIETQEPVIQYTDLDWGRYTLKLNASNTSGIWSKHVRLLKLIIRPPWWATWWAILIYIAGIVTVGYILVQAYVNQQEAKHLKAIDIMKARFFTNIAHEFRTPLTLILGPVETLKNRLPSRDDQYQLDLINNNATQILELVNQLIDLSKAEAHALRLNESLGNLKVFINELVHSFESQAQAKSIQLIFQAETIHTKYWFDSEKLARIITNLVANALKFTPIGGKVSINVAAAHPGATQSTQTNSIQESWIRIIVSDNGIGISPEDLPYIFDRFYRAENGSTNLLKSDQASSFEQAGTGIGLALVKELVEFQSGILQVTSKVSLGTAFTIYLPYRQANTLSFTPTETTETLKVTPENNQPKKQSDKTSLVLLVEDNKILCDFIFENLSSTYTIHQAQNGVQGWEQAINLVPDLIISDVMMPVMGGYELCENLKKDPRTSHIPVILLTAKASVEDRLEGLSVGADAYIAKPFHIQELQLRIRNLLERRRQLQQWVLASITNISPTTPIDPPLPTDPLIEKLCQLVEEHLDETTFGAEELILASGMSRMNLHRKLKALADTSAGEFIRNYRLKRAAQLLRQGHSVAETAYMVGFEDPSYFARSFRKVYQMPPSAFSRTI
ncbi:response regulator [Spirosoma sp. HMF4905]|uniref:histidine kinase n=1 Tax=Spirosoma arboris TaxID=2682092 RepID=A0A7K1SEB7_9BACT|nr:hybrid sensor histidine kinase/response regulator transcription factor [Spirosoma arboris]MVM31936.1 response regulator [Spirosoma arboris]